MTQQLTLAGDRPLIPASEIVSGANPQMDNIDLGRLPSAISQTMKTELGLTVTTTELVQALRSEPGQFAMAASNAIDSQVTRTINQQRFNDPNIRAEATQTLMQSMQMKK